jgi:hypothetical protein
MTRLMHSMTMKRPLERHPSTSETGVAVAKDLVDRIRVVPLGRPYSLSLLTLRDAP